jgi:hypothetical protein
MYQLTVEHVGSWQSQHKAFPRSFSDPRDTFLLVNTCAKRTKEGVLVKIS